MNAYAHVIQVGLAFFSLLVGLGLTNILEEGGNLEDEKTAAFLLGIFLFLRFVTGSAVHLSHVYVDAKSGNLPKAHSMLFDSGSLLVFGLIAVRISYSNNSVEEFLWWNIVLLAVALTWSSLSPLRGEESKDYGAVWYPINLLQGMAVGIVLALRTSDSGFLFRIDCPNWMPNELCWNGFNEMKLLVLIYAFFLVIDVWRTLMTSSEQDSKLGKIMQPVTW